MRPGAWSTFGFLSPDASLEAQLAEDANRMADSGIEAGALGRRLAELLRAAEGSDWSRPVPVGDHEIEIRKRRGLLTCPWAPGELQACRVGEGGATTANQFVVSHPASGRQVEGFVLSAHLIRDHAFFGGRGTRVRIEPEDAVAVLFGRSVRPGGT
jgi:hypothetical protein